MNEQTKIEDEALLAFRDRALAAFVEAQAEVLKVRVGE